jgi:hypothetical protein
MNFRLTALFLLLASFVFAASNHRVDFYQPTTVNGVNFKAGEVKVEVNGDKVVLKQGKVSAEAPIKVENANDKFRYNLVGYVAGTQEVKEIVLGGTTTKLVFEKSEAKGQ